MKTLGEVFRVERLTSGRRKFALAQVAARASTIEDRKGRAIADRAQEAHDHEAEVRELELRWEAQQAVTDRDALRHMDAELDRGIVALHTMATTLRDNLPETHPHHGLASSVLSEFFPNGTQAITELPYDIQIKTMLDLVLRLRRDHPDAVDVMGVGALLVQLEERIGDFEKALEASQETGIVTYDEVRRANARGQELMLGVIALVCAVYYDSDDDEHVATRTRLMAPITYQNDRIRELFRRREFVDVDPETGDEG